MRRKEHIGALIKCMACCGLLFTLPVRMSAQQFPLDEKSRYENELENKINESIFKILGPDKAKVMIQGEMDFTRTEKVSVEGAAGSGEAANFKWAGIGPDPAKKSGPQLLPGFPVPSVPGMPAAAQEARSYATQLIYPPSFVKRLTVTLIINKGLPDAEAENIRFFVSDILNLNAKRGDEIIIVRAPFASFWKTIWFTPEAVNIVFKYGLLSLAVIVAMLAIMAAIMNFSGSMNSMAKAQQISMDFGRQADGPDAIGGAAPPGLELKKDQEEEASPDRSLAGEEETEEVVFRVRPDQVPVLVHLMARENPANVSLIAAHLPLDIRGAFLKALPPEMSSEVIAHLAEFRFVKPDMIIALKEELERRFLGAVGGMDKVLQALDNISLKAKRDLLLKLGEKHPEIARKVRAKVILFEDLSRLEPRDISVLISAVKVEDWAAALGRMDEDFKGKLKSQMAEKTWQMVEQSLKYSVPSEEKSEKTVEEIVNAALKLIKEGRISSPLEAGAARELSLDKAGKEQAKG